MRQENAFRIAAMLGTVIAQIFARVLAARTCGERLALHQLHHQVTGRRRADVVERADLWMVQRGASRSKRPGAECGRASAGWSPAG